VAGVFRRHQTESTVQENCVGTPDSNRLVVQKLSAPFQLLGMPLVIKVSESGATACPEIFSVSHETGTVTRPTKE
jgi:hypothetical protein